MKIEATYNDLFQDKLIFKDIGREDYYEKDYPTLVKQRNRKPTRFIKYMLNIRQAIRSKPRKKGNLLFLEHKFERIARNLSDQYNIYLLHDSIKIYREFRKYKYFQYFYRTWLKQIDKSFTTHNMDYATEAMESVQSYLIKNDINLVLVGNDKMFMEKLLLLAARNANIPTVVIQHGIYTDEVSFQKLKTADTAVNFWAWSQYVKDCYLRRYNRDEKSVKVIGYPFELIEPVQPVLKSVLFIGNNYKKGDPKAGEKFVDIAKTVLSICEELNILFNYRPHPGEIIDSEYGDLKDYIHTSNTLLEDIDSANIVIGDISSVMIEAGLCGRDVIQILWNELSRTASKDPMYSFTIKVSNERDEIKNAITRCLSYHERHQIEEYYMYRNPTLFEDIRRYIEELINQ